MAKQTKYVKGEGIFSIDTLAMILENHEWVYMDNRPKHWAWVINMSLFYLMQCLRSNRLHCAVERKNARVCDHADSCTYMGCLHHIPHVCRPGVVKCYEIQQDIECVPLEANHA